VPDPAAQFWPEVKDSNSIRMLEKFAERFPDSAYASLANAKIADLKAEADRTAEVARQAEEVRKAEEERKAEAARQAELEAAKAQETQVAAVAPPAPLAPPPPQNKPGDTFRDCDNCPEMVVVPAGTFTMGAPSSEPLWMNNEQPQRQVNINQPFAIGKYEVTFDEWDACVADGGCGGYRPPDQSWGRGKHPVINVSWEDAKAYAAWLSKKTGQQYRLPTEAEWEYAARAGTTTPFWWGSSISTTQANYDGGSGYGRGEAYRTPSGERRGMTVPVDSFAPNAWGLYQVHGNASEWVEDCYNDSYEGAPTDGSAWISGDCESRVLRSGSWDFWPQLARSAARSSSIATNREGAGFRVVRSVPQ
jgi:formylglycine-generating enzyme required for sulfatase activity